MVDRNIDTLITSKANTLFTNKEIEQIKSDDCDKVITNKSETYNNKIHSALSTKISSLTSELERQQKERRQSSLFKEKSFKKFLSQLEQPTKELLDIKLKRIDKWNVFDFYEITIKNNSEFCVDKIKNIKPLSNGRPLNFNFGFVDDSENTAPRCSKNCELAKELSFAKTNYYKSLDQKACYLPPKTEVTLPFTLSIERMPLLFIKSEESLKDSFDEYYKRNSKKSNFSSHGFNIKHYSNYIDMPPLIMRGRTDKYNNYATGKAYFTNSYKYDFYVDIVIIDDLELNISLSNLALDNDNRSIFKKNITSKELYKMSNLEGIQKEIDKLSAVITKNKNKLAQLNQELREKRISACPEIIELNKNKLDSCNYTNLLNASMKYEGLFNNNYSVQNISNYYLSRLRANLRKVLTSDSKINDLANDINRVCPLTQLCSKAGFFQQLKL